MSIGMQQNETEGAAFGGGSMKAELDQDPTTDRTLLVCFSGKIGCGKTSVSRRVAKALGCRRASFGGYLRGQIAERGGDPDCRRALQDLGQSLIQKNPEAFCRDVLVAGGFVAGEDFVLDGLRHAGVVLHLMKIAAPSEVRVIFLEASVEARRARAGQRCDFARRDFERAARHEVEADMEADLPSAADTVVDGSLPLCEAVNRCIGIIERWRAADPCQPNSAGNQPELDRSAAE